MKKYERDEAVRLRKQGASIKEIARKLDVSKASVSVWVRDIELTSAQRKELSERGQRFDVSEIRRKARLENSMKKRLLLRKEAALLLPSISSRDLWLVGIALYWGEGGKTQRGGVRLSNSDPLVIGLMMKFFEEVCRVPETKFRGHVHTFSHLNREKAEQYWSEISGIPLTRFYKTYVKKSIASKDKKDSLPYGTFQIYVHDVRLFTVLTGWIERLGELTLFEQKNRKTVLRNESWSLPKTLLSGIE